MTPIGRAELLLLLVGDQNLPSGDVLEGRSSNSLCLLCAGAGIPARLVPEVEWCARAGGE